jgi:deoxyribodipyrimidine photolyase
MHNRVRLVAGSFLVKDPMLSWNEGTRRLREIFE